MTRFLLAGVCLLSALSFAQMPPPVNYWVRIGNSDTAAYVSGGDTLIKLYTNAAGDTSWVVPGAGKVFVLGSSNFTVFDSITTNRIVTDTLTLGGTVIVGVGTASNQVAAGDHNHDATYVNDDGDTYTGTHDLSGATVTGPISFTANAGSIVGIDSLDVDSGVYVSDDITATGTIEGGTLTEGGTGVYNITESDAAYQPLEATLTDIADGTIAEDLVNTANPWADNEVADDITVSEANDVDTTGTKINAALNTRLDKADFDNSTIDTAATGKLQVKDGGIGTTQIGTDGVSADELNATGVESELEAVLDLQDLQGTVTDDQVPNTIGIQKADTGEYLGADTARVLLSDRVDTSTAGLVFNGGNIAMAGAETVDGVDLSALNTDVAADSASWNVAADGYASADNSVRADIGDTINARMTKAVTGNTETGITVTYQAADSTYDFVVALGTEVDTTEMDTTTLAEIIRDKVEDMLGGTETRITVSRTGDDIDFVVDDMNDDIPEAGDYTNLTGGDGITHSPTGTIAVDADIRQHTLDSGEVITIVTDSGFITPLFKSIDSGGIAYVSDSTGDTILTIRDSSIATIIETENAGGLVINENMGVEGITAAGTSLQILTGGSNDTVLFGENEVYVGAKVADSQLLSVAKIVDTCQALLTDDAIQNPVFEGGATFYGPLSQNNIVHRLNINKGHMVPPDYWLGDTANHPDCDSLMPWGARTWVDTNFIDSNGIMWPDSQENYPKNYDSVRAFSVCLDPDSFAIIRDSGIGLHVSVVKTTDWPTTTSKDIYMAHTPLDVGHGVSGQCDENPCIIASSDGINWTNQVDTGAGDTIRLPVYNIPDFIIDTYYVYINDTGDVGGAVDTIFWDWPAIPDSTVDQYFYRKTPSHLLDPDICLGADGNLWLLVGATFDCQWNGGQGSYTVWYMAHSTDGTDWSDVTQVSHFTSEVSACAVLRANSKYDIYSLIDYKIYKRSLDSLVMDSQWWPSPTLCTHDGYFAPDTCDSAVIWHMDVTARGDDELIMIFNSQYTYGGCATNINRFFGLAQSIDGGDTWTFRTDPIYQTWGATPTHDRAGLWDTAIYRPSFIWLNDDMDIARVYYSGKGQGGYWHIGFFDYYFDVNDSSVSMPLTDVSVGKSATNAECWFPVESGDTSFLFQDSATAASASDTVALKGHCPFDFESDSLILIIRTTSANQDSIILDSISFIGPKYGQLAADSFYSGVSTDTANTSLIRLAYGFNGEFKTGQEIKVKLTIDIPNSGESLYCQYAAIKGRRLGW